MKWIIPLVIAAALLATGCASTPVSTKGMSRDLTEGYSLLYKLMNDESKVDDILIIKSAPEPTANVIKQIGETARAAVKTMDGWNQSLSHDGIGLEHEGLPKIEQQARSHIAGETARALLFYKDFELRLLITQDKATSYANALAYELARLDENEQRSSDMDQLAEQMSELRAQVFDRLTALTAQPEEKSE